MINNLFTGRSGLIPSFVLPIKEIAHTLTTELQKVAPQMTEQHLSQFGEEKVEQLLQQQFVSLLTVSSQAKVPVYPSSDEELALFTVLTSHQEGLLNNENSDELMARLSQSVTGIHAAYANTSDIYTISSTVS